MKTAAQVAGCVLLFCGVPALGFYGERLRNEHIARAIVAAAQRGTCECGDGGR